MAQVDFYILPDDQPASLQHYVCKLAEQAWLAGQRVLIQTDSANDSQQLDELLWSIRSDSFIPHGIATLEAVDQQQPILISHQKVNDTQFHYVVNISSRPADITPENMPEKSLKIDEILNQNEDRKQTGRQLYKTYRALGYQLQHHTLDNV